MRRPNSAAEELADATHWAYQYANLGLATSAKRYRANGTEVGGQLFTYLFDDIGNRQATGGRASAVSTYAVNQLNQSTSPSVPATVEVVGLAKPSR